MKREEIKNAIKNNDFIALEKLFFEGVEKEKYILFYELMDILDRYNHIKNIMDN